MAYWNDYETDAKGNIVRTDASGNKYSTDAKGNKIVDTPNQGGGNTTPETSAKSNAYNEYIEYLRQQEEADQRAKKAAIDQGVNKLESQRPVLEQMFKDSARDAYVQKMMSQRNLPQQLASQGISGGMSESSNLALETGYGNAYNNLQQQYNSGLNQINSDVANLKATGDISLAETSNQYAQKMADIALQQMQYQQQLERQQMSGGSGISENKPRLSLNDVLKLIENGDTSDGVRQAYEYYVGSPYGVAAGNLGAVDKDKVAQHQGEINALISKSPGLSGSSEKVIGRLNQLMANGQINPATAQAIASSYGVWDITF